MSTTQSKRAQRLALSPEKSGGETGIRTLGTLTSTHDFQSCPFDRSGISPDAPQYTKPIPPWQPHLRLPAPTPAIRSNRPQPLHESSLDPRSHSPVWPEVGRGQGPIHTMIR